jgi:aspartate aminotransferase
VARLNAIGGLECAMPQGAFYVYPSCASLIGKTSASGKLIRTDEDLALDMLEHARVAVVHGAAFGAGPNFRVSYAASLEQIALGCERIAEYVDQLI